MGKKVFIEKCQGYDTDRIYEIIRKGIECTVGIEHLKTQGKNVLLKPNILTAAEPEEAVTTHPAVFEAAVRFFSDNGFSVSAGDSPAIEKLSACLRKNGFKEIMDRYGVQTADFENTVTVENPGGLLVKKFTVAKAFKDADFIVNLPKLKTHSMMYHTGAMKNLFGLVKGLSKSRFHVRFPEKDNFAEMITDLNVMIPGVYTVLDAVVSMHGHGPRNGKPYNSGFIALSECSPALDFASAAIIGYDPYELPVIKSALRRKKNEWIESGKEIEYTGMSPDDFDLKDFEKIEILSDAGFIKKIMPEFIYNFIRNFIIPKPFINHEVCVKCRKCEEICAAGAAVFSKNTGRIKIDYSRCISCYCCHEICPYDAIKLKRIFRRSR